MEGFYYFRLGSKPKDETSVLYYSNITDEDPLFLDRNFLPNKDPRTKRLVLVSDTHDRYRCLGVIPAGDNFVHAGDILMTSSKISVTRGEEKLRDFNAWLGDLDFKHKIVIGGNHDKTIERIGVEKTRSILSNSTYLENESLEIDDSIKLFATPLSSGKSHNDAFQAPAFNHLARDTVNNLPKR